MDLVGQTLGERYRVERFLGSGRFASVYAAADARGGGAVAIKVFKPSTTRRTDVGERFFRRTRAARRSPHPVFVPITDAGRGPDGVPFLVMELLEGRTVEQDVGVRGAYSLERSLHVAAAMLEGLAAAHGEGHVHRNVNPSNLFLVDPDAPAPTVRVLDLGVARDLVDYLAIAPSSIGSTRFLAPELLLDAGKAWTAAVDVFAAGMVFYFMLTGRLPFDREAFVDSGKNTINAYASILKLPPPSKFAPHVPGPIDALLSTALAIRPAERFVNAGAMLVALDVARAEIDRAPRGVGLRAPQERWAADRAEGPATIQEAIPETSRSAIPETEDLFTPHVPPPPADPSAVCDPTVPIELPEARPVGDDTEETELPEAAAARATAPSWTLRELDADVTTPGGLLAQLGAGDGGDVAARSAPAVAPSSPVEEGAREADDDSTTRPLPVVARRSAVAPGAPAPAPPVDAPPPSPPASLPAEGGPAPPAAPPPSPPAPAPSGRTVDLWVPIAITAAVAFVAGAILTLVIVLLVR
jgi:serine/threonine-protein kinase